MFVSEAITNLPFVADKILDAAVILVLHQLLADTLDNNDALDIIFAIDCFDTESARGQGSEHLKYCARVLRDMTTIVQRLRNGRNTMDELLYQSGESPSPVSSSSPAVSTASAQQQSLTTAYDVGFILNPEDPPMMHNINPSAAASLYGMLRWEIHGNMALYNQYLI
jgi:hypothetical protein